MKLFTGCLAAGLALVTAGAQAQILAPYEMGRGPTSTVSDFGGPYAAVPPEMPGPRYGGPMLLPPMEVYTVVRESGFSPLGVPHQRGLVYTIAVVDRSGEDGRLIIDARTGRIIRFIPADRMGDRFNDDLTLNYGPPGALPPPTPVRAAPRPPRSIPHVASHTVPVPKASPLAAKPAAAPAQQTAQQAASAPAKPVEPQAAPSTVTTGAAPAKPVVQIAPTQDMPKVMGLE